MITELNNVNLYCYKLCSNRHQYKVVVCAKNKEDAFNHVVEKIKKDYDDYHKCDFNIQEDDIMESPYLELEIVKQN